MLIQSDFHDYYDAALGVGGIDTDIVFRRYTKTLADHDLPEGWTDSLGGAGRFFGYYHHAPLWQHDPQTTPPAHRVEREYLIGFCGEIFYGIEVRSVVEPNKRLFFFDDEIGAFITDYISILQKPHHYPTFGEDSYALWMDVRDRVSRYRSSGAAVRIHQTYNTPVFVYLMRGGLVINPCLREYGFMRVKDTFTAFQEVQMYVGGVLPQAEHPLVEVSERDKLLQHGFDEKWSFRNPDPPKRKQKKK